MHTQCPDSSKSGKTCQDELTGSQSLEEQTVVKRILVTGERGSFLEGKETAKLGMSCGQEENKVGSSLEVCRAYL